jgi:hypothetical protein
MPRPLSPQRPWAALAVIALMTAPPLAPGTCITGLHPRLHPRCPALAARPAPEWPAAIIRLPRQETEYPPAGHSAPVTPDPAAPHRPHPGGGTALLTRLSAGAGRALRLAPPPVALTGHETERAPAGVAAAAAPGPAAPVRPLPGCLTTGLPPGLPGIARRAPWTPRPGALLSPRSPERLLSPSAVPAPTWAAAVRAEWATTCSACSSAAAATRHEPAHAAPAGPAPWPGPATTACASTASRASAAPAEDAPAPWPGRCATALTAQPWATASCASLPCTGQATAWPSNVLAQRLGAVPAQQLPAGP